MAAETKYAHSGSVNIAYQVHGDGPIDLVMAPGWIFHLELVWEDPSFERTINRLLPNFRVILFDKRGTGLSDRAPGASTLEERMDDVRAVMDAVGSESAAVMGWSEGGSIATLFAATYPERTRALILYASAARFLQGVDYPHGVDPEAAEAFKRYIRDMWGQGYGAYIAVPSRADDEAFRRWFGRYERLAVSPGEGLAMFQVNMEIDMRHLLPTIRVPTLILHQTGDRLVPIELSRYMAERIPDAKFVELPGIDHLFWFGDPDPLVEEIQEFLLGVRSAPEPDRVLATIMFSDIVGSTERASGLGDRKWRDLLDRYLTAANRQVTQFRGREVKSMGDGFLATFDGPARAVRCGFALREAARELGIQLRTGIHTGEVELMGQDVGGIAVHIGARVAGLAEPNEVLASSTVKDLVSGSGIRFAERGTHQLKGVPDEWRLYAAEE